MPTQTPSLIMPRIQIPTGYETQELSLERKRKIAQALMEQGMGQTKYNNWGEVVGALAQAWAGKSMLKDNDKAQAGLNTQIATDYRAKSDEAMHLMQEVDSGRLPIGEAVAKVQGDPILMEIAKPLIEAWASKIGMQGKLLKSGDSFITEARGLQEGHERASPKDSVIRNPDNPDQIQINPVAATANMASSGHPPMPGTGAMSMDFAHPQVPVSLGAPAPAPTSPDIPAPALQRLRSNPTPQEIQMFEEAFGPGSAKKALNLGGPTAQPSGGFSAAFPTGGR